MSKTLTEIAQELKNANKKVQLIYAFNGTGKTRLSKEFKRLINGVDENDEEIKPEKRKVLYYNAYTEDLFYWDNDLENDVDSKLKIQPNSFTNWILEEQGQNEAIIKNFQHYTNSKIIPRFNEKYETIDEKGNKVIVPSFSEITFSPAKDFEQAFENIKISKGEESNFIWSIFYSLFEQIIYTLNNKEEEGTSLFDDVEYIFVDDPVSSLDENHLIELAVDLAQLVKSSKSDIKFIITTHNSLFYNVLYNEFRKDKVKKYVLNKQEDGSLTLDPQENDSPFSYHLYLKTELERAIETGTIQKYHFNHLRNILEKTATFLGKDDWIDLLPKMKNSNEPNPYEKRILNLLSHAKHSGDEVYMMKDSEKKLFEYLVNKINEIYKVKIYSDTVIGEHNEQ